MTAGMAAAMAPELTGPRWTRICRYDEILPERGVAALVGGLQVAVFRTFDGVLHAVGNQDPFTGAFVLSRGIVGSRGDIPTVASPLHKQVFDLRTGRCLDDDSVQLPVYTVRCRDGAVELAPDTGAAGFAPDTGAVGFAPDTGAAP